MGGGFDIWQASIPDASKFGMPNLYFRSTIHRRHSYVEQLAVLTLAPTFFTWTICGHD